MAAEREERFAARVIDEVLDRDRVIVSGPAYARTGFERAYVALTIDRIAWSTPRRRSRSRMSPDDGRVTSMWGLGPTG